MTSDHRPFTAAALLLVFTLGVGACASKTPPKTTTISTQSTTTNAGRDNTSSETKETTTQQRDGSTTVQRSATQTSSTPAPATTPKIASAMVGDRYDAGIV
jgi:hypothetical protein